MAFEKMVRGKIMKKIVVILFVLLNIQIFCDTFYFAQVTDLYIGAEVNFREREQKMTQFRIAALPISVNKLKIPLEFVAFTGNITNNGVKYTDPFVKNGLDEIRKINVPLYFVPGNHDIYPGNFATRFNLDSFKKNFGDISFSKEIKGVKFIFFYGENLRIPSVIEGYDPFGWLENELITAEGKPVVLITHSMPGDDYSDDNFIQVWDKDNGEKLKIMLNSYNVRAVIAGHEDCDKMRYIGKIPVFIAPNFSLFGGRQASYRVYKYNNGEVSYFTRYIEQQ